LPNGDVLVAETDAPPKPDDSKGVKGKAMKTVMKNAGSGEGSANRITLLRDKDGDGNAETKSVFAEDLDRQSGLSSVSVQSVMRETAGAVRQHNPDHPLADANGDVWAAPVDENAEMVEMLEASRQYQNLVEALSTAKQLMLETMRMK
jgi:flagellar basal-body rod protein FlgC